MFVNMACVIFMLLMSPVNVNANEGKVALIAAKGSAIEKMHLMDIRRLFLGFKLSVDGAAVKNAVLNVQSKLLYDEFMKNVMHMTEGSYKRKMVKRVFRQGRKRIREVSSLRELNDHLLENVGDISFVEMSSIDDMESVEVVQILW